MFILKILYSLLLFVIIPFALPIGYLVALKKGEDKDFFQRLGFISFPEEAEKSVWFHCASVGEVRSLKLITDMVRADFPDMKILISTTTATGKAEAEKTIEGCFAFLLPLENPMAVEHIISYMNVKALILVDTELWPSLIRAASRHTRLFLFNARISDRTFKSYMRFRFIFGRLLSKFETIYTKSEEDTERFTAITDKKNNIVTLGNIKFQTRKPAPEKDIFAYLDGLSIFAAASTHAGEEKTAVEAFIKAGAQDRIVIAPRHKNRTQEAVNEAKKAGLTVSTLSEKNASTQAVVVDRFGTLEELYSVSERIFVGGSMNGTGGHNIYEALQFEKTVCVGSNMSNFAEIYHRAASHNTVYTVNNADEMAQYLVKDIENPDFAGLFDEIDSSQKNLVSIIRGVFTSVYTD